MSRQHTYQTVVTWTGNKGSGTSGYRDFGRDAHKSCFIAASVNFPVRHEPEVSAAG